MNNFDLHTPTRILFGKGAIEKLREQIPAEARVLITYGGGSVKKTGVLDQVLTALNGLDVLEFGGIEPNPSYETLMNAVKLAREEKVTFLLAVGGGSVLDGTKFIAAAAHYDADIDPWEILETYGSKFAEGILLTLIEDGPKALQEPENYNVRANIMWAATQALNGLIGAGVPQDWATHMLGHELTAMHGLDHAQTLAIVLPALWNEKRDAKREKLLQYAERVWNITEGSDDQRIDAAIAATRQFFEQMGVPTRLSDYGLDGSSIPALLAKLEEHGMTKLGEHQDITLDVSRRIYEAAR